MGRAGGPTAASSEPITARPSRFVGAEQPAARAKTPSCSSESSHQQYFDKNPAGYCGLSGTGFKLSDPFETN